MTFRIARACAALVVAGLVLSSPPLHASGNGPGSAPADRRDGRVEDLLRRINDGGPPLSDSELSEVLDAMPTETVDVSLIMIAATVLDRRGRPLSGLKAKDFTIVEKSGLRPLSWFSEENDKPARVVILLDVSGSMGLPEQQRRTRAAIEPLFWQFGRQDQLLLVTFSNGKIVQHGDWTYEPFELLDEALSLPRQGKTAIIDAVEQAARALPVTPGERQAIILITDGIDNASRVEAALAARTARSSGVPVHVVVVAGNDQIIQDKRSETSPLAPLRDIAHETGGRFFLITGLETANDAALTIRKDLRHQYWLAFRPSRPPDGTYRPIRVQVQRRGAQVLARQGYR